MSVQKCVLHPEGKNQRFVLLPHSQEMEYEGWLLLGLQPPIGLIQERPRPSCMSGVANLSGSGEVLYPAVLGRWSVYFEDFKVDYGYRQIVPLENVGCLTPPPLGARKIGPKMEPRSLRSITPPPSLDSQKPTVQRVKQKSQLSTPPPSSSSQKPGKVTGSSQLTRAR